MIESENTNPIILEEEKCRLLEQKNQFAFKQHHLQTKLTAIRNDIKRRGLMPKADYDRHLANQIKYNKALLDIEQELAPIKQRLNEIASAQFARSYTEAHREKMELFASPAIVSELVALRQHYQEFAADLTRISSMRQMAADFVLKLSRIIKDDLRRPMVNAANGTQLQTKANENRK